MKNLEEFGSSTTIHGIASLINSKSVSRKLTWAFIIIIAFGSLSFMSYRAIEEFSKSPTSLQLSFKPLDEIPTISLFVQNLINKSEVEAMGLTKLHMKFLLAHSPLWVTTWENMEEIEEANPKRLQTEIQEVARFHNFSLLDLLRNVSYGWESLIDTVGNTAAKVSHDPFGIYGVNLAGHNKSKEGLYVFVVNQLVREVPFVEHRWLVPSKYGFVVGNDYIYEKAFVVAPDTQHTLAITPTLTTLLNRPSNPCRQGGITTDDCMRQCWYAGIECQYNCTWWSKDIQHACYLLNPTRVNWTDRCVFERERCLQNCIPPCQFWKYNPQLNDQGPRITSLSNGTNIIVVILSEGWRATVYEEKYAYSWSSFVGNVGGLMGLFFGASLISIVHFCCYLCSKPCAREHV